MLCRYQDLGLFDGSRARNIEPRLLTRSHEKCYEYSPLQPARLLQLAAADIAHGEPLILGPLTRSFDSCARRCRTVLPRIGTMRS